MATGCGAQDEPTDDVPPAERPPFSLLSAREEIQDLLTQYPPEDPGITAVYEGGNTEYLPTIYRLPATIGILDEQAAVSHIQIVGFPIQEPQFSFKNNGTGQTDLLSTFSSIQTTINVTPRWHEMNTHEAKNMALHKEARTYLQDFEFAKFAYRQFQQIGEFNRFDSQITDDEIAIAVGLYTRQAYPQINRLHDFAPYLTLLQEYDRLLPHATDAMKADLEVFMPETMYREIKNRRIPYEDIEFNSPAYIELGFADSSPWAQYVQSLNLPPMRP
jgi:hypothetical protein